MGVFFLESVPLRQIIDIFCTFTFWLKVLYQTDIANPQNSRPRFPRNSLSCISDKWCSCSWNKDLCAETVKNGGVDPYAVLLQNWLNPPQWLNAESFISNSELAISRLVSICPVRELAQRPSSSAPSFRRSQNFKPAGFSIWVKPHTFDNIKFTIQFLQTQISACM